MSDDSSARDLETPIDSATVLGLVSSLLVAELLAPSQCLWILSAWVSDIPILDNRAREFRTFVPEWPARQILLSDVIRALANRGGQVVVVVRDEQHNRPLVSRLLPRHGESQSAKVIVAANFHQKGIVGDDFVLDGSMNFTHYGISLNDEHLVLRRSVGLAQERQRVLEEKWSAELTS